MTYVRFREARSSRSLDRIGRRGIRGNLSRRFIALFRQPVHAVVPWVNFMKAVSSSMASGWNMRTRAPNARM